MKASLPLVAVLLTGGMLRAQSDPGFRLRPAPVLPSFRQTQIGSSAGNLGGCRNRPTSEDSGSTCASGMCQMRLDYTPLTGDREDLQVIVERLRRIQGNYPQIGRALGELSNLIHHIEEQTEEPLALNSSAPSGQPLAPKSPAEGGRPQVRRDSSQPERHDPLLPQPIVFQGQGSAVSLGGMVDPSLSCALNTP